MAKPTHISRQTSAGSGGQFDLEFVREHAAEYLGGLDSVAAATLYAEVLRFFVERVRSGISTKIKIQILPRNQIRFQDDGSDFPYKLDPVTRVPQFDQLISVPGPPDPTHWSKLDASYDARHGLSVVNALTHWFEIDAKLGSRRYSGLYIRGHQRSFQPTVSFDPAQNEGMGITISPDSVVFGGETEIDRITATKIESFFKQKFDLFEKITVDNLSGIDPEDYYVDIRDRDHLRSDRLSEFKALLSERLQELGTSEAEAKRITPAAVSAFQEAASPELANAIAAFALELLASDRAGILARPLDDRILLSEPEGEVPPYAGKWKGGPVAEYLEANYPYHRDRPVLTTAFLRQTNQKVLSAYKVDEVARARIWIWDEQDEGDDFLRRKRLDTEADARKAYSLAQTRFMRKAKPQ